LEKFIRIQNYDLAEDDKSGFFGLAWSVRAEVDVRSAAEGELA